ncbi:hypothetical protein [Sodalis ligni]|uniref:Uncharacterized protein n=1 Tax=Sodalis ligni TaxID=2697027 RepID=A0A4R1NDV3_9GAMM|nr:hypothetical protein [Sodalis ligni]TCL05764.1 hypothetical protein EZJ58_3980 [Sodalis ligni]
MEKIFTNTRSRPVWPSPQAFSTHTAFIALGVTAGRLIFKLFSASNQEMLRRYAYALMEKANSFDAAVFEDENVSADWKNRLLSHSNTLKQSPSIKQ